MLKPLMTARTCAGAPHVHELLAAVSRRSYNTRVQPLARFRPLRPLPSQCILQQRPSTQQRRHAGDFWGNARKVYKANPFSVSLALIMIVCGAGTLLSVNWYYHKYLRLHNYPEEVAKQLRKAIYYNKFDFKPNESIKYYKEAIVKAEEVGMDCWSDEVIGIKVTVADLMERLEQWDVEIKALEVIRRDLLKKAKEYEAQSEHKKDRNRLLKWATKLSVKLGELYSKPEVWHREAAETHLSWAVQTMIQERQRRTNLKLTDEEEGDWMSTEELAATCESLGQTYEANDQHYLAAPLFLHAINLYPIKSCHTVILMNNLASSLSQQSPRAAAIAQAHVDAQTIVEKHANVPVSRELLLEMAQTWAHNALDLAAQIAPPDRTEECDIGCAVTTHNLGELAEMAKDFDGAKKRYREAISLARAIGFQEGIENSSARLRKLESTGRA
ncbi:hypothetical protein AMS68_000030 [Peltaster fructicola]|uniref:TPR domain-containing protein n=1 Tax=Peltaster fructicola TaxID=286661 RepID=A0A6H0XIG0_9PEZI|nr:hypothetical protein AMS68_000030 [Peltaster fructicola]